MYKVKNELIRELEATILFSKTLTKLFLLKFKRKIEY